MEVGFGETDKTGDTTAVVTGLMGNKLFDLKAQFHVSFEVISRVVGTGGFNFGAIVGDEDLAHGIGVGSLLGIATLPPEWTVVTLGSGETKDAAIAGLRRIGDG